MNWPGVTAEMVDAALKGEEVPVNDTETYENGVKIVPSSLLIPYSVDVNNWEEVLVDSGYYTAGSDSELSCLEMGMRGVEARTPIFRWP